jgi:hypothetical protein
VKPGPKPKANRKPTTVAKPTWKPWTDAEDEFILACRERGMSPQEMAGVMDRVLPSIVGRLRYIDSGKKAAKERLDIEGRQWGAIRDWPKWARFDINGRTPMMKQPPAYSGNVHAKPPV